MITLNCPTCSKTLNIDDRYQGQTGRCNGCKQPVAVPVATPAPTPAYRPSPPRRGVYIILGIFLGGFGAHNFYAGRTGTAVAQLCITLFTWWLILPLFVVAMWVVVDLITVTHTPDGERMI